MKEYIRKERASSRDSRVSVWRDLSGRGFRTLFDPRIKFGHMWLTVLSDLSVVLKDCRPPEMTYRGSSLSCHTRVCPHHIRPTSLHVFSLYCSSLFLYSQFKIKRLKESKRPSKNIFAHRLCSVNTPRLAIGKKPHPHQQLH